MTKTLFFSYRGYYYYPLVSSKTLGTFAFWCLKGSVNGCKFPQQSSKQQQQQQPLLIANPGRGSLPTACSNFEWDQWVFCPGYNLGCYPSQVPSHLRLQGIPTINLHLPLWLGEQFRLEPQSKKVGIFPGLTKPGKPWVICRVDHVQPMVIVGDPCYFGYSNPRIGYNVFVAGDLCSSELPVKTHLRWWIQVLSPETRDRIVCMPGWDRLHDLCLVWKLSVFSSVSLVTPCHYLVSFSRRSVFFVDKTCRFGSQLADIDMLSIGKRFFIHICAEV